MSWYWNRTRCRSSPCILFNYIYYIPYIFYSCSFAYRRNLLCAFLTAMDLIFTIWSCSLFFESISLDFSSLFAEIQSFINSFSFTFAQRILIHKMYQLDVFIINWSLENENKVNIRRSSRLFHKHFQLEEISLILPAAPTKLYIFFGQISSYMHYFSIHLLWEGNRFTFRLTVFVVKCWFFSIFCVQWEFKSILYIHTM